MPPSRGHVTNRKVATPEPDRDPDDDADTEGEEQQEEGSNTDASGNEERVSSTTKKACVDINAVHKEYIQSYDNREESNYEEEEERGKESSAISSFQQAS